MTTLNVSEVAKYLRAGHIATHVTTGARQHFSKHSDDISSLLDNLHLYHTNWLLSCSLTILLYENVESFFQGFDTLKI